MKKLLIMAAVAGLAFTSCTNDEEDLSGKREQEKVQISFAPPVNYGMTRAYGVYDGPKFGAAHTAVYGEMMGTKYDICQNFTVYGKMYQNTYQNWASSKDVFGEVNSGTGEGDATSIEVSYVQPASANGWFPQYPYFFYDKYKYAFGAVSPDVEDLAVNHSNGLVYDGTGLKLTKYKSDETVLESQADSKVFKNHFDVMFANRIYDVDRSYAIKNPGNGNAHDGKDPNNGGYNGVNMKFHHALASVHFKVCIDPDFVKTYNETYGQNGSIGKGNNGADVTKEMFQIKSIKIVNVRNTGDFAQKITDGTTVGDIYTKGAPAWNYPNDEEPYKANKEYIFLSDEKDNAGAGNLIKVNVPDPVKMNTIALAATDIVNVTGDPATVHYSNATDNNFKIFDTVTGRYGLMLPQTFSQDAAIVVEYDFVVKTGNPVQTVTKHLTKTIKLSNGPDKKWEMGKKYTYVLAFRGDLIYFAPQVEDWEEGVVNFPNDPQHPDPDDHIVL